MRDDSRLARSGAGENQHGTVGVHHGLALFGVERREQICIFVCGNPRRDPRAPQEDGRGWPGSMLRGGRANLHTRVWARRASGSAVACYSTVTLFARFLG